MTEMIVKISVGLISTLGVATKQIKEGRMSEFSLADTTLDSTGCREIQNEGFRK
jgi:hypothetical protein